MHFHWTMKISRSCLLLSNFYSAAILLHSVQKKAPHHHVKIIIRPKWETGIADSFFQFKIRYGKNLTGTNYMYSVIVFNIQRFTQAGSIFFAQFIIFSKWTIYNLWIVWKSGVAVYFYWIQLMIKIVVKIQLIDVTRISTIFLCAAGIKQRQNDNIDKY